MSLHPVIFLALAYVRRHLGKSVLVTCSLAVMMGLPAAVNLIVGIFEEHMVARSQETPFVLGAQGSRLDLIMHGLYFVGEAPGNIPFGECDRLNNIGLAQYFPVFTRHTARKVPVSGVTLEYFEYRNLSLADGRLYGMLGQTVVGAAAAGKLGLQVGSTLVTDSDNVFNIAGSYPLELTVSGVLNPTGTPDDDVLFVDLRTSWLIEGIGHGHQELNTETSAGLLLEKGDKSVTANAAVLPYTRITKENAGSIHFHGDQSEFPLTQILVVPGDERSASILEGRYLDPQLSVQLVRPDKVVSELLSVIFKLQALFSAQMWVVGVTTIFLVGLVISLSLRLREREMRTFFVMGCSPWRQLQILSAEVIIYIAGAAILSGLLLWGLALNSDLWIRLLTSGTTG